MSASLALLFALSAAGDPADDAIVSWRAPAECPTIAVAQAQIRRSLAGLAVDPAARVRAEVAITREAARRYRLELTLDVGDGPGERALVAESCGAAVDTAAWLIAIAIDVRAVDPGEAAAQVPEPPRPPEGGAMGPDGAGAGGPGATSRGAGARAGGETGAGGATEAPTGEGAPPTAVTELDATPVDGAPDGQGAAGRGGAAEATRRLHVDAWIGGGIGLGLLPAVTGIATGGLALSGRRWQVALGGHFWAPRQVALDGDIGGRFSQGHASLQGCPAWELGPARLAPCAGLAVGGLRGQGSGPVVARTAQSLWVGLLVGAQAWLRVHPRIRVALQADAVVGLRRPGFTLEPAQTVLFRPSPVGFSGLAALVVRLR